MNNIVVSIVIPVYNRENTLCRTFETLDKQANKNVEIVFVNDGSIDKSKKLIEEFIKEHDKLKIKLVNQKNMGVMKAREAGIFTATGEYIMSIDAGDQLADNAIETILSEIDNSLCDYYVMNSLVKHSDGSIEERTFKKENVCGVNNLLTGLCPYSVCFKVMKRELFTSHEVFEMGKEITNGEDFCISLDFMLKTKNGKLIDKCLYIYNKDEGSLRANEKKAYFLNAIDYAKYRLDGKYKEELDYLIFTKTIMKIILEKNSNGDQELLQYYKSSNVHNNKYIKFKLLFEIFSNIKIIFEAVKAY